MKLKLPPKKIEIEALAATEGVMTKTISQDTKSINKPFKLPPKKDTINNINPILKNNVLNVIRDNKITNNETKILTNNTNISGEVLKPNEQVVYDNHGNAKIIELNSKQLEFKNYLKNLISCCLIGAAGTGKTTCTNAGIQALIETGLIQPISMVHKYIPSNSLGIIICAYTRRAVNNIRRQISGDLKNNCITIHKLLEYSPVIYEILDETTGKTYKKRLFEPKRNALNTLDSNIKVILIDEASMLSVDLWNKLIDAIPDINKVTFVFIGDINQLPPTFGLAILGFKLNELPVIELDHVYRQALESPIIRFAHRILSGKPIYYNQLNEFNETGKLQIVPYPKKLPAEKALLTAVNMFKVAYDNGSYNPEEHTILIPQVNYKGNEKYSFTAYLFNKYLATHIARKNNRAVYEIIAGFTNVYYSIGDYVIFDKNDAIIINIEKNDSYLGKPYQAHSLTLDYFGHDPNGSELENNSSFDIDKLLEMAVDSENEGDKLECSHLITIQLIESDTQLTIETVGGIKSLDLAYSGSIHKAQGSEWVKVYLLIHNSNNVLVNRELLYTAVTRAREQLIILCENDTFNRGINTQAIRGNTLQEKAEFFKGKKLKENN